MFSNYDGYDDLNERVGYIDGTMFPPGSHCAIVGSGLLNSIREEAIAREKQALMRDKVTDDELMEE